MSHTSAAAHPRRWAILAVLCLSLLMVIIDNTIVNVALPTLSTELGASTTSLQWIVDAYTLVFSALLLALGHAGDRFGRKRALQLGLVLFAATSALAAMATTSSQLVGARALMGIGAALIFPATLAILVTVFTDTRERATAIGIWSACTGLAVALGPVTGGYLLEHFAWGSIFLVNIPLAAVALALGWWLIPDSRDPAAGPLDRLGLVLSAAGVGLVVWAVIEAPERGWTSTPVAVGGTTGLLLLAVFAVWERRLAHPLLEIRLFSNPRFTAASLSVTTAFFALFGFIFNVTQYFQVVRGYGTLEAGVRTVPFALFTGFAAPISAKLAYRFGTKSVVAAGLASMSIGFAWTTTLQAGSSYWLIVGQMMFMGGGLGLVNAPATEAIMGSLPPEKAGVGSAVNDTARELGGTLGVAIVGSLFASVYASRLGELLAGSALPPSALAIAQESVGAGAEVARRTGLEAGPEAGRLVQGAVNTAFLDGFHFGSWVSAGITLAGAAMAIRWLPSRAAASSSVAAQEDRTDALV